MQCQFQPFHDIIYHSK